MFFIYAYKSLLLGIVIITHTKYSYDVRICHIYIDER